MATNEQKHVLLTFPSLQQMYQELKHGQQLISKRMDTLEESIRHTNTPKSTAQSPSVMTSILQGSFDEIGDILTIQVCDFPQLRKVNKAWHSPMFSIGDKVRVRLAVYPSGVGRGQGSHVSVSLTLMEVLRKEEPMCLDYNVSVAAIGQHTHKTLELCTTHYRPPPPPPPLTRLQPSPPPTRLPPPTRQPACSARFRFPSPGEVL